MLERSDSAQVHARAGQRWFGAADVRVGVFAQAGADVIIVHYEVSPHLHRNIQKIKAVGKQAGVALNPSTPVFMLQDMIPLIDLVLIMTINPGFGGQELIPETLAKITQARQLVTQRGLSCDIEVDGGINIETAWVSLDHGANVLVAGTSVFHTKDYAAAIRALRGG